MWTLLLQLLAVVLFVGLITIAVLAFIEPGPLDRRSRYRQGQPPTTDSDRAPAGEPKPQD